MNYLIYGLAAISIFWSIGGLYYEGPKKIWVIVSSMISITFSCVAIYNVSFWPLVVGFTLNWGLRLLGLEPKEEVVFEGASEKDREIFSEIVTQVALIYKTGQQREMYLKLKFEGNVQAEKTEAGEMVYRMFGNRSFSKDALYNAFKDGVIDAVQAYTP